MLRVRVLGELQADVDGAPAAVGWLVHHEYDGAVPVGTGFKGVRLRVGNVQIGGHALLEGLFTEARFNSWSIGEVHVLDRRVVPNARDAPKSSCSLNAVCPASRDATAHLGFAACRAPGW